MKKIKQVFLSLFLILSVGFLSSCDLIPPADSPQPLSVTEEVSPTAESVVETPQVTPTDWIQVVVIPADATGVNPTLAPTLVVFPTATATPGLNASSNILIRFVAPGPMSKVVSPIKLIFYLHPNYTGSTRIELIGESGRELFRKVYKTSSPEGNYLRITEEIPFEIPGAAELARLQISTLDKNGRLQAFHSVRLLLLTVGENQLTQAYPEQERLLLRTPKRDAEISGGEFEVSGEFNPLTNSPLIFELLDDNGTILGSRIVLFEAPTGDYQAFTASIPYNSFGKTPVRLIARQADDRIAGTAYLFSIELTVSP